jgi:plastocyanin domain-containing protein
MKSTAISIIIASILIGGAIYISKEKPQVENNTQVQTPTNTESTTPTSNVTIENGRQIVSLNVRGGYNPRKSVAKANISTILRFSTNNTFDCSSSIRIPSMNINKILPQSGTTDIDLGVSKVGILSGTCGMGMYSFEIDFQN